MIDRDPDSCAVPVEVTTSFAAGSAPTERFVIDHGLQSDRSILGRHSYWAMRNGVTVITRPLLPVRAGEEADAAPAIEETAR